MLQGVFNTIAEHLMKQKRRSGVETTKDGFQCRYRAPNGDRCAVGCLIKDEFYTYKCEGKVLTHALPRRAIASSLGLPELPDDLYRLLRDCQELHDFAHPDFWASSLIRYARLYRLEAPRCLQET